jgi:hypothetical protein
MGSPLETNPSFQGTLEGTGILPNSSSCNIHAEAFKLLPHAVGKTTVNVTQAHIVLNGIEKILNVSEESMLQADKLNPIDVQHLNEIWERATSRSMARGIGVDRIVAALKGDEPQQQSTNRSWFIDSICLLSGMGIIGILWYKCTNKRAPGVQGSQRPSGANSNQPINM